MAEGFPGAEPRFTEFRQLICRIPGVINAQIVSNRPGVISELHVLSLTTFNPKNLARDIQSALMAKFGFQLDHKVISIAQITPSEFEAINSSIRLACNEISYTQNQHGSEARVTLANGKTTSQGNARTFSTGQLARQQMLACATLDAVHSFFGKAPVFSLREIKPASIGGSECFMVCVNFSGSGSDELLLGTAFFKDDPNMAVVRATLDAINRRLAYLA